MFASTVLARETRTVTVLFTRQVVGIVTLAVRASAASAVLDPRHSLSPQAGKERQKSSLRGNFSRSLHFPVDSLMAQRAWLGIAWTGVVLAFMAMLTDFSTGPALRHVLCGHGSVLQTSDC